MKATRRGCWSPPASCCCASVEHAIVRAEAAFELTSLVGCARSMTPGLAFFEAGLLRSRNSISILMQCWTGLCILSCLW